MGSNFICMQLKEKETAYYFYIAEGIGHSLSYSPMKDNRHDILSFLNRLVLGKEKTLHYDCREESGNI